MSFLLQYKAYILGGGVILGLLLLANHLENNGIREEEASKWKLAISEAIPDSSWQPPIKVELPIVSGTAKSKRTWSPDLIQNVHSDNDIENVVRVLQDSLEYYRWIAEPFMTDAETLGAKLAMTAIPLTSEIKYELNLPPKEVQVVEITKHVLEPAPSRNFIVGIGLEHDVEFGAGWLLGREPIVFGATYFKNSSPHYKLQFQFRF
jgi:hypothetical protein